MRSKELGRVLARLSRCRSRQWLLLRLVGELTESSAGLRWCRRDALLGGNLSLRSRGVGVLEPPLAELILVHVEPVLLRSNNHTRAHEAHESNELRRSEAIAVDEVGANEAASTAETSFAVNSNVLLVDGDNLVGKLDELANKREWRAGSILENHVEVLDAEILKVVLVVEVRVEADDESDVARNKVAEDILEGDWKVARQDVLQALWEGTGALSWWVLGAGKGQKVGSNPVEVAHVHTLVLFVLVEGKVPNVQDSTLLRLPHTINNILNGDSIVRLRVTRITERHEWRLNLRDWRQSQVWRP